MSNEQNKTERAKIATDAIQRLGVARALEATKPNVTPEPNKFGVVGVDLDRGTYRARIRVCDALSGYDKRITLGRYDNIVDAAWAYKAAHVALWGTLSWAATDLSPAAIAFLQAQRS